MEQVAEPQPLEARRRLKEATWEMSLAVSDVKRGARSE